MLNMWNRRPNSSNKKQTRSCRFTRVHTSTQTETTSARPALRQTLGHKQHKQQHTRTHHKYWLSDKHVDTNSTNSNMHEQTTNTGFKTSTLTQITNSNIHEHITNIGFKTNTWSQTVQSAKYRNISGILALRQVCWHKQYRQQHMNTSRTLALRQAPRHKQYKQRHTWIHHAQILLHHADSAFCLFVVVVAFIFVFLITRLDTRTNTCKHFGSLDGINGVPWF